MEEKYPPGRAGFSKIFHIETMRRIPVDQDQEVRDVIGATTYEGRLFPQALSDEFGKLSEVDHLVLRAVAKEKHFQGAEQEMAKLLEIDIYDAGNALLHRFLLNAADLSRIHTSGWHSFQAAETAKEFVRLFKIIQGMR